MDVNASTRKRTLQAFTILKAVRTHPRLTAVQMYQSVGQAHKFAEPTVPAMLTYLHILRLVQLGPASQNRRGARAYSARTYEIAPLGATVLASHDPEGYLRVMFSAMHQVDLERRRAMAAQKEAWHAKSRAAAHAAMWEKAMADVEEGEA